VGGSTRLTSGDPRAGRVARAALDFTRDTLKEHGIAVRYGRRRRR
jgi:hypothetical protein